MIATSPEACEPVPLPPLITKSPASPEDAAPPETVNDVSSSPITNEAPPEESLIITLPFVPCDSSTRLIFALASSGSTALTTTFAEVLDTCNLVLSATLAVSTSSTETPAVVLSVSM